MRFDTKIGIAVRSDLAAWQKLNVTAFLAGGIAVAADDMTGLPYEDGEGNRYLPLFRQPVLVFAATQEQLAQAHTRALSRDVSTAVYTEEMFKTGNDDDNRAAVREAAELRLVGLAVHGRRNDVDKVLKAMSLHN
ncbi:DUF2000 domain-containing protein [Microtetraspora sp. AC03309]|uniref:DUF2000 domain-containing protein n=1 Tax=Microtetraspora sp. AC03309 TaxID=2779376 RepID=UPI001E5282DE|nr:DUF2000 domain-containing protein [Microtetraspora sp. AC03309]MCC5578333.1 DUF2000 domain-containing protein [Microtetraspora sp. AC03309]